MGVLSWLVDEFLKLQGPAAYALVGGLAFGESALFVGFVLPGETAILLGGVLANQDRVSLPRNWRLSRSSAPFLATP